MKFSNVSEQREMTAQEKENYRSLQVKVHYCELIQYEIQKLTEDQIFKVLVLVKNTVDEMGTTLSKPIRSPRPSLNRALFDAARKTAIIADKEVLASANNVREILKERDLNMGYGIISMMGKSSSVDLVSVSEYICFCIPNKVDLMIEVCIGSKFILSVSVISEKGRNVTTLYSLDTLIKAIDNIIEKYD